MYRRLLHGVLFVMVGSVSAPSSALAQGEGAIQGTVRAEADRSAVSGAAVALQGNALPAPLQSTTSNDGRFVFSPLAPGDYEITVAHGTFQEEPGAPTARRPMSCLNATQVLHLAHAQHVDGPAR